jgi:hypothetical protein
MPAFQTYRRPTFMNCGEGFVLGWHKQHRILFVKKATCRKIGCPSDECRLDRAKPYIENLMEAGNDEAELYIARNLTQKQWEYVRRSLGPGRFHRVSFKDSNTLYVISKDKMRTLNVRSQKLPQMDALIDFRRHLMRKDLKRVTPKVPSSPLIVPVAIDEEEVITKALACAEYKLGQPIKDQTLAEIEKNIYRYIPNKGADQRILTPAP